MTFNCKYIFDLDCTEHNWCLNAAWLNKMPDAKGVINHNMICVIQF